MKLIQQIALTKTKGIGPKLARNLFAYCSSVEEVFTTSKKSLMKIPGIGEQLARAIVEKQAFAEAEKEVYFIEKHRITPLWIGDKDYPQRLTQCDDAPLLLYYKGSADLNHQRIVSIVGTRNSTHYGKQICQEFLRTLQPFDTLIISGLAYGIDALAHQKALINDIPTVGVLGHGLDRIYPAPHRNLAAAMLEKGGLLTEFPSDTRPDRQNFPMRNRIIAGLSDVTIVVEAAIKGGALITAEIANSYNRDVCAFPGSIYHPQSEGSNYLIKTNRAHMIRHAGDLGYLMNWVQGSPKTTQLPLLLPNLSQEQETVYDIIREVREIGIDSLLTRLQWPQSKLAMVLLELEMETLILALPGKIYKLTT